MNIEKTVRSHDSKGTLSSLTRYEVAIQNRVLCKILIVYHKLYCMGSLVPDTVTGEYILPVKGVVNYPVM